MAGLIFVARESGVIQLDGERVVINAGHTRVREGHPLLDGHEDLFEPLSVHYDVEDAEASPGRQRGESAGPARDDAPSGDVESPESKPAAKPARKRTAKKTAAATDSK